MPSAGVTTAHRCQQPIKSLHESSKGILCEGVTPGPVLVRHIAQRVCQLTPLRCRGGSPGLTATFMRARSTMPAISLITRDQQIRSSGLVPTVW